MAIVTTNTGALSTSVAQLFINSLLDGQEGQSLTNFTCYLETSAIRGAKHMEFLNITLANWVKPFHSENNRFLYLYNGSPFVMGIDTSQYYTPTTLVAELNANFVASAQNVTVVQNPLTGRLDFTTPGGTTFQAVGHFDYSLYSTPNRANLKLGFTTKIQPIANGSTISAQIPLRVQNSCIYIASNLNFDGVQPSNLDKRNLSIRVPLYGNYGDIVSFVPSQDQIFKLDIGIVETIQFQIFDENFLNPNDLMESQTNMEIHFTA